MVFSSLFFLYFFLPITLCLYFLSKKRTYRNLVLTLSSLFFYAWGEPVWVSLLLISATVDYFNGLFVEKYRGTTKSKYGLINSIFINLSILGFFKYSHFISENMSRAFSLNLPYSNYALPVGISFYTFQTISYVIDVYKGEIDAQKKYFDFLLFVSLFHQLVAGPIVRYKDIAREIKDREENHISFSIGISRFLTGLGKKVLFANTFGDISKFFLESDISSISILGSWFGVILFSLQIYFDFSGYSDMAIGLGKMFGFNYKENFNYPYISTSATDFWRRWHMSLGSFFKDYVYIPLGGNKKRATLNLFLVWGLTGLWHGASWNFIFWGLFYGTIIGIEKLFLIEVLKKFPKFISHVYLILITLIGWTLFYFTSIDLAIDYLKVMFGFSNSQLYDSVFKIHFLNNLNFLFLGLISVTPFWKSIFLFVFKGNVFTKKNLLIPLFNLIILIVSTSLLVSQTYNPFLYFRF